MPILVVLFALMPMFWSTYPVELNTVMSACYGVFDVIIWYMVASTAYDFSVSGFVIGGIVRGVSIIARLVGIGIGYVVMLIPESPSMLVIGVSVGAVYVLAMLALFQQGGNRFSFLSFGASKAKDAERESRGRFVRSRMRSRLPPPADRLRRRSARRRIRLRARRRRARADSLVLTG